MTAFSKHICMDLVVIQVKISQLFERSKFKWKFSFQAIVGKTPGEAMSANEETNKMKEDEIAKMVSKKLNPRIHFDPDRICNSVPCNSTLFLLYERTIRDNCEFIKKFTKPSKSQVVQLSQLTQVFGYLSWKIISFEVQMSHMQIGQSGNLAGQLVPRQI